MLLGQLVVTGTQHLLPASQEEHFDLLLENYLSPITSSFNGTVSQMFFPEFLTKERHQVQARPESPRHCVLRGKT